MSSCAQVAQSQSIFPCVLLLHYSHIFFLHVDVGGKEGSGGLSVPNCSVTRKDQHRNPQLSIDV